MRPALRKTDWAITTVPVCDCTRVLPQGPNQASCQPGIYRPRYWNHGGVGAALRPPATRGASLRTRTGHICLKSRRRRSSQPLTRSFAIAATVPCPRRARLALPAAIKNSRYPKWLRRARRLIGRRRSPACYCSASPCSEMSSPAISSSGEARNGKTIPTSRSSANVATPHHNAVTATP